MEICEQLTTVGNIIQVIQKAKKILLMYPANNPIYIKTLKELSEKFGEFFQYSDSLKLHIGKNDIFYDSESVYKNTEMHDNLALLFFKDGLRELTFKNGLTTKEIEDFIKIISIDFERDEIEEDIITLFWEKDFENIQYIVEDIFLSDGAAYEKKAMNELQQNSSSPDSIKEIYNSISSEEAGAGNEIILPITDDDIRQLLEEFQNYSQDKTYKYFNMLFECLNEVKHENSHQNIVNYFMMAIEFAIKKGNLLAIVDVQSKLKALIDDEKTDESIRQQAVKILSFTGGHSIIELIGNMLNNGYQFEETVFKSFSSFLNTNAILPLINILGELKTIHTRKLVIDALVDVGRKNTSFFYEGLNDSKWYVVRNMVHILRKIGEKSTINYILKPLEHEDVRVKKEVIRALGELGGDKALTALRKCIQDNNIHLRRTALNALVTMGTEAAKQIIMEQISGKHFNEQSFYEKKSHFEALANWKGRDVYDFLVKILARKSIFQSSKDYDKKACAVYCLGLLGSKDAVPILSAYKKASNKLLREFSFSAIQRIENGI
jgi:HEAT repeat protein